MFVTRVGTGAWLRVGLVVATFLLVATPAAIAVGAPLPPGGTFLDDDGSPFESSIEAISAAGLTTGCGPHVFCPARPVTRAQAAAFLVRALGEAGSLGPYRARFPDVAPDAWYRPYVERLAELGVVAGYPEGDYRPLRPVSRAEFAAILVRALPELAGYDVATTEFTDVPADAWYRPAVDRLHSLGIVRGCRTEPAAFCPGDSLRRDHLAVLLARALQLPLVAPPSRYEPLNGLPARDAFAVWRRVMAVKIDNARGARPQSGLQQADAVIETLVEGGLTRLIALFHQSDSTYLGPVRSGRPTDTGLLLPLQATLAVSGGQPWILSQMAAAGVPLLREAEVKPPALFRFSGRVAPYNVYSSTEALRAEANARHYPDQPPPDLFVWAPFSVTGSRPASFVAMSWSDPIQVSWSWDGSRYRRALNGIEQTWVDRAGGSGRISADTVVVLFAPVYEATPPNGSTGSSVPALATVGSGRALVFARGTVVEGTWSRDSWREMLRLSHPDGSVLTVPPGIPWVSVFPADRTVSWK